MAKRENGGHDLEKYDRITFWVPKGFKARLKEDAQHAGLPKWCLTNQIVYELMDRRGLWNEPYRPAESTHGRRRSAA